LETALLAFEIRWGNARIRIGEYPLVVGRSADCEIVLDSAAVSRRHAELGVLEGVPFVHDLGSANGVFVNGRKVERQQSLTPGDLVVIGDQELRLLAERLDEPSVSRSAVTLDAAKARTQWKEDEADGPEENTDVQDAVELLGAVAERLLSAGDARQASEVLGPRLLQLLERARSGKNTNPSRFESAAANALRLAAALSDPSWVGYVFELYSTIGKMLPEPVLVTLHDVVRKLPRIDLVLLRDYLEQMRAAGLSSHDRFLLKRLEGLERVAALR
jgi:hypothetical protein